MPVSKTHVDRYLAKGWIPVPENEYKRPAVNTTKNEDGSLIEKYADNIWQAPTTRNIGIHTGKISGIIAIDIDIQDDGLSTYNKLIEKYGPIETLMATTPNKGLHLIFEYDSRFKTNNKILEINGKFIGIDLKSDGGKITVHPSQIRSDSMVPGSTNQYLIKDPERRHLNMLGKSVYYAYKWINEDEPISKIPEWLADCILCKSLTEDLVPIIKENINPNDIDTEIIRRTIDNTPCCYLFEVLNAIPNQCYVGYDSWSRIGMAICSFYNYNDAAYESIFDEWSYFTSEKAPDYYNEDEMKKTLARFMKYNKEKKLGLTYLENLVPNKQLLKAIRKEHCPRIRVTPKGQTSAKIDYSDPYNWFDFYTYLGKTTFESYDDAIKYIKKNMKRVCALIKSGKSDRFFHLIWKDINSISDPINLFKCDYKITSIKYFDGDGILEERLPKTIPFKRILGDPSIQQYLPIYDKINNIPNCTDPKKGFSIWQPFKAKINEITTDDLLKIKPILDFIEQIWAAKDHDIYEYLLTWLRQVLMGFRTNIALYVYGGQGTGKNTLTDFLIHNVLGENNSRYISHSSLDAKFNSHLLQNLLVVSETPSYTDRKPIFDKIKELVTGMDIQIEYKGIDYRPVIHNNANIIMFGNHIDGLFLEQDDRRWLCLETSDDKKCNSKYFKELHKLFTDENGSIFASYLMSRADLEDRDITQVPSTELKEEIIDISLSSPLTFMNSLMDEVEKPPRESSSSLFEKYKTFCSDNGYRPATHKSFSGQVKRVCNSKRTARGIEFDLNTIKPSIEVEPKIKHKASKKSLTWLNRFKEQGLSIRDATSPDDEKSFNLKKDYPELYEANKDTGYYVNGVLRVDGYDEENKTVYEFNGCYYHGCPTCYRFNRDRINPRTKKTIDETLARTEHKHELLRKLGFNLVTCWEHTFNNNSGPCFEQEAVDVKEMKEQPDLTCPEMIDDIDEACSSFTPSDVIENIKETARAPSPIKLLPKSEPKHKKKKKASKTKKRKVLAEKAMPRPKPEDVFEEMDLFTLTDSLNNLEAQ